MFCAMLVQQPHFPELKFRTMLRMSEVENTLRRYKIFKRVPARSTLIEWKQEGLWEGTEINGIHYVFEDSLEAWLTKLQQPAAA